jgi:hypothetical protein
VVNQQDVFDRLHLDDHGIVHQQIQTIATFDMNAVIVDGKQLLRVAPQSSRSQFMNETCFVSAFEQARTEPGVNLYAAARMAFVV